MAQLAADLAARGWHVFPLLPGSKRPAVDRWEQRACADPATVRRCWPGPLHNIGVAPGPSGLVGVDLDPPDGRANLQGLGRPVPATLTVSTARDGGEHLYFVAVPGRVIRNSASKIAPHVDVRGSGGYLVGPGSIVGGRTYRITSDLPPAPLPIWLADLACAPARSGRVPSTSGSVQAAGSYARAALRAELDVVAAAAPGGRNHQLNRSAFSLGQLVGAGLLEEDLVAAALCQAAGRSGLLADDGPAVCERTIRSGLSAGSANPRQVTAA